jgi:uncharacterized membrane protein YdbT with pleckstrin-like domain
MSRQAALSATYSEPHARYDDERRAAPSHVLTTSLLRSSEGQICCPNFVFCKSLVATSLAWYRLAILTCIPPWREIGQVRHRTMVRYGDLDRGSLITHSGSPVRRPVLNHSTGSCGRGFETVSDRLGGSGTLGVC